MMMAAEDNNNPNNPNVSSSSNNLNSILEQNGKSFSCRPCSSTGYGVIEVPTDDDEDEENGDQEVLAASSSDFMLQTSEPSAAGVPSSTPPARRLVLLKRPNIPRGHSPASASEIPPSNDGEPSVATPSASSPAICSHETKDLTSSQCPQVVGESSRPSTSSESSSRASECAIENTKATTTAPSGTPLTLEQREQAYEEARRRIFGSPPLEDETSPIPLEPPVLSHPPVYGQPRPLRPRPYRTPPMPLSMPGSYPSTTNSFIPHDMNWSYPNIVPSSYPDLHGINSHFSPTDPSDHHTSTYFATTTPTDFANIQPSRRVPFTPIQMHQVALQPPPPPLSSRQLHQHHYPSPVGPVPCSDPTVIPSTTGFYHHQNWDSRPPNISRNRPPLLHSTPGPLSPQWGAGGLPTTNLYQSVLGLKDYDQPAFTSSSDVNPSSIVPPPPPSSSNHTPISEIHIPSPSDPSSSVPRHPPSQCFQGTNLRVGRMEPRNMFADLLDPDFHRTASDPKRPSETSGARSQSNHQPLRTYDADFPPLG